MLFRGVGRDWISRIMLAHSQNGLHFDIVPQPVIQPLHSWEKWGCEDPRLVNLDGKYHVTYTAFDGVTARLATSSSPNLLDWEGHHLVFHENVSFPNREHSSGWHKAAAIFPEKIDGWYYMFFGDNHIWSARSRDLKNWHPDFHPVLKPRPRHFDAAYIEMGPPPIKTDKGWLILYHGVNQYSKRRIYRLGAALVSLDDPHHVIWRCHSPILQPEAPYERIGYIDVIKGGFGVLRTLAIKDVKHMSRVHSLPRAVFCCGAILEDGHVRLYYGAADTIICTATIDLDFIFDH